MDLVADGSNWSGTNDAVWNLNWKSNNKHMLAGKLLINVIFLPAEVDCIDSYHVDLREDPC